MTDPLVVPRCEGVTVHIVTESDDPLWSFAAVQGPGESSPVLRRVGDSIGDKKVAYIGFNPVEASPTIWLEGSTLCQAPLFATSPPPAAAAPVAKAPEGEAPAPAKADSRTIDPDIKAPKVEAYFVYPEELRNSKRVSVFRDFLLSHLADKG